MFSRQCTFQVTPRPSLSQTTAYPLMPEVTWTLLQGLEYIFRAGLGQPNGSPQQKLLEKRDSVLPLIKGYCRFHETCRHLGRAPATPRSPLHVATSQRLCSSFRDFTVEGSQEQPERHTLGNQHFPIKSPLPLLYNRLLSDHRVAVHKTDEL